MADNTTLNTGTGGDLIATDELSTLNGSAAPAGLKVQRVKLGFGADGNLQDVSDTDRLPVALSAAQLAALAPLATQPISAAALPLPAGAATEATLTGLLARTPALGAQNTAASTAVNIAADQVVPMAATGELIEALEAMRYAIQALTRSVGLQTVDAFGRNRVVLDALGGAQTLGTVTTVGTVTTLTTLTNQAQLGGLAAQDQIPALMHLQADNLRRNITVS